MSEVEEPKNYIQIKGPDYLIRNTPGISFNWDLYLLKVVNKGKPNEKYEFKSAGYSRRLESCIKDIIAYRTQIRGKKLSQGDADLMKIMKIWMEEKTKLLSVLDLNEEEWAKVSRLKKIPLEQLKQRDLVDAEVVETSDEDDEDNEENEEQENED